MTLIFYNTCWRKLHFGTRIIGLVINSVQLLLFLTTVCMDPGIPSSDYYSENFDQSKYKEIDFKMCPYCQIARIMREGTQHCYDCGICIEGYDHHCVWSSKCIGKNNYKCFKAFLWSSAVSFCFYIISIFIVIIYAFSRKNK